LNPGALEQILHVDASVPDPLPPWKIRLNINFLLDDFTETNGATLVVPGSHLYLRKPTRKDAQLCQFRKLLAPKGSMVIWNGHLWHKSGSNFSQTSRSALLACFSASFMREIAVEENYLEVMDRRHLEASSEILKELVGFNHGRKLGA
jgi:ectoine hydroxylase-related dioxygenase (phytanoyl-CoA dioxygenase family)